MVIISTYGVCVYINIYDSFLISLLLFFCVPSVLSLLFLLYSLEGKTGHFAAAHLYVNTHFIILAMFRPCSEHPFQIDTLVWFQEKILAGCCCDLVIYPPEPIMRISGLRSSDM